MGTPVARSCRMMRLMWTVFHTSTALHPTFKGVWYAAMNCALLSLLDTRPDQCLRPHRRSDAGLGRHGLGGLSHSPWQIGPALPGQREQRPRPLWAWPLALYSRECAGYGRGDTGGPAVGSRHTRATPRP